MNNEPKNPQPKKTSDQISQGLVLGAGLGIVFGILSDNLALGIGLGGALGLVLGAAFSLMNKK